MLLHAIADTGRKGINDASGVEPEHGVIRNAASPRSLLILGRWKARIV